MKWQREWSILTLFLVPALIKFFLFNLTSSLNMYFNVLRKPTFSTELYGCPVRLRYHTPFFLAVCGYHFWSPWQRWKHVCLVVRTSWQRKLSTCKPEKTKYKSYFDKLKKKSLNSSVDLSLSLNYLCHLFPEPEQARKVRSLQKVIQEGNFKWSNLLKNLVRPMSFQLMSQSS